MIYLIEAIGAGLVKIGFTDRPVEDRLRELQTASPHRLKLVASFAGTINQESQLHEAFDHLRAVGEWFRIDDELRSLMWMAKWMFWRIDALVAGTNSAIEQANKSCLLAHNESVRSKLADILLEEWIRKVADGHPIPVQNIDEAVVILNAVANGNAAHRDCD